MMTSTACTSPSISPSTCRMPPPMIFNPWPMIFRSLPITDFSPLGVLWARGCGLRTALERGVRGSSACGSAGELRVNIKAPVSEVCMTAPAPAHHWEMVELCRQWAPSPLRAQPRYRPTFVASSRPTEPWRTRHTGMTEDIDVKINVDTLMDGDQYFVRTEIETRSVTIHGPFPDLQMAQKLKAEQIGERSNAIEAIKRNLHETVSRLTSR